MKLKWTQITIGFALLAVLGIAVPAANARSCSLSGVAGTYGYTTNGSIPALGAVAGMGHITLDSSGNATGAQTVSFNGAIVPETLSGTYSVNADCTGTATINVYHGGVLARTTNLNLVYVNEQREFRAIFLSAGTVLTVNGTKTFRDED